MGRQNPADSHEPFCMTVLAIKLSTYSNGVSKLHGDVARDMWKTIWTGLSEEEVPITSITNGVHVPFWISRDLATLYDRYMGPGWTLNANDGDVWKRIDDIPDTELWRTHERRRERLVGFARRRLLTQLTNRGVPQGEVLASSEALDPEVLTIGFARRVATYKRTNLLLMDPDRLKRLLLNPEHPLQIIIAGKAHPQDTQAKELIRRVIHFARDPEVRNRIIFIENYDINVARYMVQGVDCWLNTPRRPMEASGTSGMKAAANGALNISIPDGWWCEAELLGENGWSIGKGENYKDPDEQDIVESEALYEILEKEVVPMFYERGSDGVPRKWVQRMKKAIGTCCPVFNTHRMVSEYGNRFYVPCTARRNVLKNDNRSRLLALSAWKQKVASCWRNVHFTKIESAAAENLPYGTKLSVTVELYLDQLSETDVVVELCFGKVSRMNEVVNGEIAPMAFVSRLDGHVFRFEGSIPCNKTGLQGFTARVIPAHEDLAQKHETCLVTWA
jgi:starch phosphorylase